MGWLELIVLLVWAPPAVIGSAFLARRMWAARARIGAGSRDGRYWETGVRVALVLGVAPARQVGTRLAHQLIEATGAQVALQEFQPGVRREANVIELQRQIPIDTGMQIGFFRLTVSGLACVEEGVGVHHLSTTLQGLFQSQSALVRNSRSRSIIALHPEIRGPA